MITFLIIGVVVFIIVIVKNKFFPISEKDLDNINELKQKYGIPENVTVYGRKNPQFLLKAKNYFSEEKYMDFKEYPKLTEKEKLRVYLNEKK
jgi:hypothetical protein